MCFPGADLALMGLNAGAQFAINNAQSKAAKASAARARQEADQAAESERDRAQRIRAALRTGYARAGVAAEGSPVEALTDRAAWDETRAQTLLTRGYGEADDLERRAGILRADGFRRLLGTGASIGYDLWERDQKKAGRP